MSTPLLRQFPIEYHGHPRKICPIVSPQVSVSPRGSEAKRVPREAERLSEELKVQWLQHVGTLRQAIPWKLPKPLKQDLLPFAEANCRSCHVRECVCQNRGTSETLVLLLVSS